MERVYQAIILVNGFWAGAIGLLAGVGFETSQAQGNEGSIPKDQLIFELNNFMMSIWRG